MNRRDFVKFLGVSTASLPIANALAKIPEVEPQIILLNKPKDIIIARDLPDVDFVIDKLCSINYYNNENVRMYETVTTPQLINPTVGSQQINIEIEYEFIEEETNLFKRLLSPRTFTFNLQLENSQYSHLMELNGRKFMLSEYTIAMDAHSFMRMFCSAIELHT